MNLKLLVTPFPKELAGSWCS